MCTTGGIPPEYFICKVINICYTLYLFNCYMLKILIIFSLPPNERHGDEGSEERADEEAKAIYSINC